MQPLHHRLIVTAAAVEPLIRQSDYEDFEEVEASDDEVAGDAPADELEYVAPVAGRELGESAWAGS